MARVPLLLRPRRPRLGGQVLGRFLGLLAWPSSSERWRASSSALRRAAASRSFRSRVFLVAAAAAPLLPGACAPRPRARAHRQVRGRARPSPRRVSVRSTTPGALLRLRLRSAGFSAVGATRGCAWNCWLRLGAGRSSSLPPGPPRTLAARLHHHRLGAAMGEILLDPALLDRARARSACGRLPAPPACDHCVSFVSVMRPCQFAVQAGRS